MRMEELRCVPSFHGPGATIFYYDVEDEAWRISTQNGDEVFVPEGDLLRFLNHCLASRESSPAGGPTLD